jgi:hypothetical protein
MDALTLLIIRHAEKPGDAWPGPGLTDKGVADDKSLVIRGWQRAGAWAALFGQGWSRSYPTPGQIYAATPGKAKDDDHGASKRPFETATPLGERLGLSLNTDYAQGDEAALAAELVTLSGVVLVAWEHKAIVSGLLPHLPVSSGTPPTDWPSDRFDVVLSFVSAAGATGFAYQMLCPQLMSGDPSTGF